MADVEDSIWQIYKDSGLVLWGIGGHSDTIATLKLFKKQMGLTFPILFDDAYAVQRAFYQVEPAIFSPYPKDYIIGIDGRIRYVNNKYDHEELIGAIEEELAKWEAKKAEAGR